MGDADGEEAQEVASAGLQLTVLDTALRPFVFFEGKGQLMSAIWSGAGSTPTSALTVGGATVIGSSIYVVLIIIGFNDLYNRTSGIFS